MNPIDYQEFTRTTAIYPKNKELDYCTLGMCAESGEFANLVKKVTRDNTPILRERALQELGDVVWYLVRLCDHFNTNIPELMETNYLKLIDRKERNVLNGSGDDR